MPRPTPWWRRLSRQLAPSRIGRDCCWYHRGDWHKVTKTAIRFLRQAQRAGIAPTCWDGGHRDLAVNKLTDELDGLKKVAAKLVHFDGAYLRFTGELRIEHQHTG
jgi:hypothetical protein